VTKLLQCLRDELVRRDYAATTIRSYLQIIEAFRQHTGARLDRITPAQLRRYHLFLLEDDVAGCYAGRRYQDLTGARRLDKSLSPHEVVPILRAGQACVMLRASQGRPR